jgi:hypothetical protein
MKKWQLLVVVSIVLLAVSFKPFHHGCARVKDKNKTWLVILAPTSRMESRGVPSDKIVKGSKLRVVGYPHKKIKDEMRAERIYVDNVKFELR